MPEEDKRDPRTTRVALDYEGGSVPISIMLSDYADPDGKIRESGRARLRESLIEQARSRLGAAFSPAVERAIEGFVPARDLHFRAYNVELGFRAITSIIDRSARLLRIVPEGLSKLAQELDAIHNPSGHHVFETGHVLGLLDISRAALETACNTLESLRVFECDCAVCIGTITIEESGCDYRRAPN